MLTPVQYANQTMRRAPPDESLSVEWVYGYQAERARNNVRYNYQGDMVYHVSKYAIVYNLNSHEQSVFTGHTEEILCLAMHPVSNHTRRCAVTGRPVTLPVTQGYSPNFFLFADSASMFCLPSTPLPTARLPLSLSQSLYLYLSLYMSL